MRHPRLGVVLCFFAGMVCEVRFLGPALAGIVSATRQAASLGRFPVFEEGALQKGGNENGV